MRFSSDPGGDPIGSIRLKELQDILQALILARPDLSEAIALIAVATGLGQTVKLIEDTNQIIIEKQLNEGSKWDY
jgi:hypothetical protein